MIEQGKAQARKLLFARQQQQRGQRGQRGQPDVNPNTGAESDTDAFWENHIEPTFLFAINSLLCSGDSDDEQWVFVGGGHGSFNDDGLSEIKGKAKVSSRREEEGEGEGEEENSNKNNNSGNSNDDGSKRRRVVTLKDVRRWYKEELDRRSIIEKGRWGFGAGGDGEEGEESDGDDGDDDDDDDDGEEDEEENRGNERKEGQKEGEEMDLA